MSVKLLGDVSAEDRKLAEDLQQAEIDLGKMDMTLKSPVLAMAYACLAHDWLQIGMEEEGIRLIMKANEVSPDYFNKEFKDHIKLTPGFSAIATGISKHLLYLLQEGLTLRLK